MSVKDDFMEVILNATENEDKDKNQVFEVVIDALYERIRHGVALDRQAHVSHVFASAKEAFVEVFEFARK